MTKWMKTGGLFLLLTGCGSDAVPGANAGAESVMTEGVTAERVRQALDIVNATDPEAALEAANMDVAGFEQLMFDIAENPEWSKQYAAGRR
jgi:hypothetical protein